MKKHAARHNAKKHFKIFFHKLESLLKSSSDRNIIQEIVVYLLKTTTIEKDEMADLIESLPSKTKDMTMSSYDNRLLQP